MMANLLAIEVDMTLEDLKWMPEWLIRNFELLALDLKKIR